MLDNSSLGVVSHQLHQSWKPQLQHLVATIAALDLDVCLHHSSGFAVQVLTLRLQACFNPETSALIQKRHPYTGSLSSETSENSKNAFTHCGNVVGDQYMQTILLLMKHRAAA
jgi:hypothetical protein